MDFLLDKPVTNDYYVEVTASRSFRFSPQVSMKRFTKVAYFEVSFDGVKRNVSLRF
jgi:hypothetical protein